MYANKITAAIILSVITITLAAQSPWAQGKGKGYSQILFNTIPTYAGIFSGDDGIRQSERFISETIIASFTEIGVTDNLNICIHRRSIFRRYHTYIACRSAIKFREY